MVLQLGIVAVSLLRIFEKCQMTFEMSTKFSLLRKWFSLERDSGMLINIWAIVIVASIYVFFLTRNSLLTGDMLITHKWLINAMMLSKISVGFIYYFLYMFQVHPNSKYAAIAFCIFNNCATNSHTSGTSTRVIFCCDPLIPLPSSSYVI